MGVELTDYKRDEKKKKEKVRFSEMCNFRTDGENEGGKEGGKTGD